MIEITCQVKELVEKLTVLSKVNLGSMKSLAPISVRVNDNPNLCELCLLFNSNYNQHSTYADYYAYLGNVTCEGNGMFVIPSFVELLTILKTIGQNDYIAIRFENDNKVSVLYGDDVVFNADLGTPEDSHIQLLNTFEFDKGLQVSSVFLDYVSDLLKVIPSTKDLKGTFFDSVVLDKHPVKSNCLSLMRTDTKRLMYYNVSLDTTWPFECLIAPRDAMTWVSKLKKKKNKSILIKSHEHALSLEYDDYRVVCLVDKNFPPVTNFIKADVDCVLTVSTEPFIKAVEFAAIGDGKNVVTIRVKNQEAEVFMYTYMEKEKLRKRILNCVLDGGKEFDFSIYGFQLVSLLKLCGETVSIHKLVLDKTYLITSAGKDFQYIIKGVTI
jgi:hypothetical protein